MPTVVYADRVLAGIVGTNIRRLRQEQKLTTAALGELVGLTQQAISNIELGKTQTPLDTLSRLAAALGVEAPTLLVTPEKCTVFFV